MKRILIRIILFFKKNHNAKYLVEIFLFIVALAFLMYLATTDVVSNVFGAVVGFLFSTLILYIFKVIGGALEDLLKINYDTKQLLKIYKGGTNYKKGIKITRKKEKQTEETSVEFIYDDVLSEPDGPFFVEDHPEKEFQLDDFIMGSYAQLFSAHSNSAKQNFLTIRLDDYNPETKTFYLSRSTYFNHLVTNRAVDFRLFDNVSLRDMYEHGPQLTPLAKSKMSNHVGINALVFLSDGKLLLPRRRGDSTISKNKITSSIAVMLNFPKECGFDLHNAVITEDYLLKENIFKNLTDRVKLLEEDVKEEQVSIRFLGFGRNIYEGGKPQFYFSVVLNDIDSNEYFRLREKYIEEEKKNPDKAVLDVDKCMYSADLSSFRFQNGKVSFQTHDNNSVTVGYERSFLCNLWHYAKMGPNPYGLEIVEETNKSKETN